MMRTPRAVLIACVPACAAMLVVIGVALAVGRTVYLTDFTVRGERVRLAVMHAIGQQPRASAQRLAELNSYDRQFAAHPGWTLVHVIPGGLFLAFAPFQFLARLRQRHPGIHRWSGRVLVLLAFPIGWSGLRFGVGMPFSGTAEAAVIGPFGILFLASVILAVVAIRRGHTARHREWMIRAFAIGIAIATVRVVVSILDMALTPFDYHPREIFALSIWIGTIVTVGAAEAWIRATRRIPIAPAGHAVDRAGAIGRAPARVVTSAVDS
jgi:uncharacterized membrane protein